MRTITGLNFDWHFVSDFRDEYLDRDYSPASLPEVMVPHSFVELPYGHFSDQAHQFVGTYFRDFWWDEENRDKSVRLRFYGVMNTCRVYLNGDLIGIHEGGYTPFAFDISQAVESKASNRLVVVVDGRETANIPPFGGVVDYLGHSGIYREVELWLQAKTHLRELQIKPREPESLAETEIYLDFAFALAERPTGALEALVEIADGDKIIHTETFAFESDQPLEAGFLLSGIERWSPDHPKLYDFRLMIAIASETIAQDHARFGCRTVRFTPEGFTINNKKLKLVGLNRHQCYPYVGYAMPKRMQELDADLLRRELGCNIVRTSHYMQSDHFLNRADEIGLLVFEEIPGWQYIGDEHFQALSLENLEVMIRHHFNHPSVILWGVRINESPDDDNFYSRTNELAKRLDDTRPTGGVRNFARSHFFEDVYTYNDFIHTGNNPGLVNPGRITGGPVPYLVTEHNGHVFPTRKDADELHRVEQAMRHIRVLNAAWANDRISGAIGWCFADYHTHREFGGNDRICHHGVMDQHRLPKYAAYAYKSQREDAPVLEIASSMTPGEQPQSLLKDTVVFTNCDYVKFYRNDYLIGTFYCDWQNHPAIPHPPVVINDYIGERIFQEESYPRRVARQIKTVLGAFSRYGMAMPLCYKLLMGKLMLFNKITMQRATELYGKYLGNWGDADCSYVFEGYRNQEIVIKKTIGQPETFQYVVTEDHGEIGRASCRERV